jgi:hypothetical protein
MPAAASEPTPGPAPATEDKDSAEAKAAEQKRLDDESNKRWHDEMLDAGMTAMLYDPHLKYAFGSGFLSVLDLTLSSLDAALASKIADKLCSTYHLSGDLRVYLVDGRKAAQCRFLRSISPTSAPAFNEPSECKADLETFKLAYKAFLDNAVQACGRGHCPDDLGPDSGRKFLHWSPICSAARTAHLLAWKHWYDSASAKEREQQKENADDGTCSANWPISCPDGEF